MYSHLVYSPECFAVACGTKLKVTLLSQATVLMVTTDHEFVGLSTSPLSAFISCLFHMGISLHFGKRLTQVFWDTYGVSSVRKPYLCAPVSMNVIDLTQCSQDQKPEAIFDFGADSTKAPGNLMRTKTLLFEKTTFPLKFCKNGRGAKAHCQGQRRYEPGTKGLWNVETTKGIVYSFLDFSKLIHSSI